MTTSIVVINERTHETMLYASMLAARAAARNGFTRIECTTTKGTYNWIYRRKDTGTMHWVNEDEFLGATEDDGKAKLECRGVKVSCVNEAIERLNKIVAKAYKDKNEPMPPQTVMVFADGLL